MIRTFRSMTQIQKEAVVDIIALIACLSFVLGWSANGLIKYHEERLEKVKFCHDRMNNKDVLLAWKMSYCKAPVLNAIDPITGKPVAGIVEGE